MENIKVINQKSKLVKSVLEELQDTFYNNQSTDPVYMRMMEDLISRLMRMLKETEEITIITDGILACKNESERLDFFLKKIYKPDQYFNEDII